MNAEENQMFRDVTMESFAELTCDPPLHLCDDIGSMENVSFAIKYIF